MTISKWIVLASLWISFVGTANGEQSGPVDGVSGTIEHSIAEQDVQADSIVARLKVRKVEVETPSEPAPVIVEIEPFRQSSN